MKYPVPDGEDDGLDDAPRVVGVLPLEVERLEERRRGALRVLRSLVPVVQVLRQLLQKCWK